jgi:flagella basal body P-ring formation protein FlgA
MSRLSYAIAAVTGALLLLGSARPVAADILPAGQPLDAATVRAMLEAALPELAPGERWSISLFAPSFPISNRAVSDATMVLDEIELPPDGGELRATLRVTLPTGETGRIALRGRAEPALEVAVPRRAVPVGTVLDADDLEHIVLPRRRLPEAARTSEAALVGRTVARRLAAGRPVREEDLRRERLVRKGEPVRVVFRRGGLELILEASALEDGAAGDLVRVLNPNGGRELRGVVVGPREVRVAAADGSRS